MNVTQENLELIFKQLIQELGDVFTWQWDEGRQALLTEFSRDKKELALPKIQQKFVDEWDKKSIKTVPNSLKKQLGTLTQLNNEQRLFTCSAIDGQPAVMAIWWPWSHGGTYSLRLTVLADSYDIAEIQLSWWDRLKNRFAKDYF